MSEAALFSHLHTGVTHVCHCWALTRKDGVRLGFTDHDLPLTFDGQHFDPASGMTARAAASTTGLSVNTTEAVGVLSSDAISASDIAAGRYDGAEVMVWQVCWSDVSARRILFRGTLGDITHQSGGFEAEVLGLTDALNQPQGRSYLRTCNAVLGDAACQVRLSDPGHRVTMPLIRVEDTRTLILDPMDTFEDGWFAQGYLRVVNGQAAGLQVAIRTDTAGSERCISLWEPLGLTPDPGDLVEMTAGCDKRAETCQVKFANFLNFQGYPHMPGDDWLVSVPRSDASNTGGSLTR